MRYRIIEQVGARRKFVLVLEAGEEVTEAVTHFATELDVEGASLTGIGALSSARLGWFNPATQEFRENVIDEQAEVLAITGNIATGLPGEADGHAHVHGAGRVRLHMHVSLGLRDASVRGGHFVAGVVSPTMELIVSEAEAHLVRGVDAVTGLILLEPRQPCPHSLACPDSAVRAAS
ncbi:MAG: PPC domain-containing DNA-binding protein [Roseicyclus sp.]